MGKNKNAKTLEILLLDYDENDCPVVTAKFGKDVFKNLKPASTRDKDILIAIKERINETKLEIPNIESNNRQR